MNRRDARRILLLHAFGHPYLPWSDMAGSFRAELVKKSPEPINLYEVSLDTVRDTSLFAAIDSAGKRSAGWPAFNSRR
jgi:hypothetical protein